MNKARLKNIEKVIASLYELNEELSSIIDEEQQAFDNLPEGLQSSERGEQMEDNVSDLTEVYDDIERSIEKLEDVLDLNEK